MTKDIKKKNRTRNDIIVEMLTSALEGTTKTGMMFYAYVSYTQLSKEYLPVLLKNELLAYDAERNRYFTTTKGCEYLRSYEKMSL